MCGRLTQVFEDWSFMLDYFGVTDNGYRMAEDMTLLGP